MNFSIQTGKNNKILRTISEKIKINEIKKFSKLWEDMVKYIKSIKETWAGLAAPQIWINKRIICVSLFKSYDDKNYNTVYMINPEIISHSDKTEIDSEWCLSIPKEFWEVERFFTIKIKFLDWKWKENILILNWLSSRIVQHEIDHLDWILFVDKIIPKQKVNQT